MTCSSLDLQKNKNVLVLKINEILSAYNREIWATRGVQMTMRQEMVGMTGGKHPQAIFRPFVRVLSPSVFVILALL